MTSDVCTGSAMNRSVSAGFANCHVQLNISRTSEYICNSAPYKTNVRCARVTCARLILYRLLLWSEVDERTSVRACRAVMSESHDSN